MTRQEWGRRVYAAGIVAFWVGELLAKGTPGDLLDGLTVSSRNRRALVPYGAMGFLAFRCSLHAGAEVYYAHIHNPVKRGILS